MQYPTVFTYGGLPGFEGAVLVHNEPLPMQSLGNMEYNCLLTLGAKLTLVIKYLDGFARHEAIEAVVTIGNVPLLASDQLAESNKPGSVVLPSGFSAKFNGFNATNVVHDVTDETVLLVNSPFEITATAGLGGTIRLYPLKFTGKEKDSLFALTSYQRLPGSGHYISLFFAAPVR